MLYFVTFFTPFKRFFYFYLNVFYIYARRGAVLVLTNHEIVKRPHEFVGIHWKSIDSVSSIVKCHIFSTQFVKLFQHNGDTSAAQSISDSWTSCKRWGILIQRLLVWVCLCVCLSASISLELHVRSSPNLHVTYSHMLCTSGFIDDIILARKPSLFDVAPRLKQWGSHTALGFTINGAQ